MHLLIPSCTFLILTLVSSSLLGVKLETETCFNLNDLMCCAPLQVLVLSTRLLRPTDIPELLFTTQRLVPDIGVWNAKGTWKHTRRLTWKDTHTHTTPRTFLHLIRSVSRSTNQIEHRRTSHKQSNIPAVCALISLTMRCKIKDVKLGLLSVEWGKWVIDILHSVKSDKGAEIVLVFNVRK